VRNAPLAPEWRYFSTKARSITSMAGLADVGRDDETSGVQESAGILQQPRAAADHHPVQGGVERGQTEVREQQPSKRQLVGRLRMMPSTWNPAAIPSDSNSF